MPGVTIVEAAAITARSAATIVIGAMTATGAGMTVGTWAATGVETTVGTWVVAMRIAGAEDEVRPTPRLALLAAAGTTLAIREAPPATGGAAPAGGGEQG